MKHSLTYWTSETFEAVFASFIFLLLSYPLASLTPSPRFSLSLHWLHAHNLGYPFLHPCVKDEDTPRFPYLFSFSSLSFLDLDDMWGTALEALHALIHIIFNVSTYLPLISFYRWETWNTERLISCLRPLCKLVVEQRSFLGIVGSETLQLITIW